MPNVVETVFSSKDTGVVETIDRINNKLPEIARAASSASAPVDVLELKLRRLAAVANLYGKEITPATFAALKTEGIPAVEALTEKILKAADAQKVLTVNTNQTAVAQSKLDAQVEAAALRFRTQAARTQEISASSSLTTRAPEFAAPNVAAANSIANVTRQTDLATAAQKRFHGATLVGSQVLRQFGVEGTRAIEVMINQFATMGVTLKDLFKSPTIGYTFLLAGVVAAGEAVNKVFSDIRASAEASLKRAEEFAKVTRVGLQGGPEQSKTELQELFKLREDYNKLIKANLYGDATTILQEKLGKGFLSPEQLNIRIAQATRRAEALGLDTRSQSEIDSINKAREAEEGRVKVGKELFERKIEQFNAEDKLRKIEKDAIANVNQLKVQLSDNPYARFYQEAKTASEQFLERNREASKEVKQTGVDLIEQLRQRSVFIENLSRAGQINDIITERAKIDAGLGGEALRNRATQNQSEQQKILDEISQRRGAGDLSGQQQNALLDRLEKLKRQSPLERITSEAIDRQIAIAQSAFGSAATAEQKRLALEVGLGATKDLGNLTSSQVDARAKFIDQSFAIQQDVIKEQRKREQENINSQKEFTASVKEFQQSVNILTGATNQIKDGVKINVVTDAPAETKVDLGQGFVQTGNGLSNNR